MDVITTRAGGCIEQFGSGCDLYTHGCDLHTVCASAIAINQISEHMYTA